jgi:uncharacterized protein YoaH (UPF0181 family)
MNIFDYINSEFGTPENQIAVAAVETVKLINELVKSGLSRTEAIYFVAVMTGTAVSKGEMK